MTLLKSCLPMACEMEAAFLPSCLDGKHHRAGTVCLTVLWHKTVMSLGAPGIY